MLKPRVGGSSFLRFGYWLLLVAPGWGAVAWLARRPVPWAIRLTSPAFGACLIWTYVAAWTTAVCGVRDKSAVLVRAAVVTLSLGLCLIVLEAPAVAGVVDYTRVRAVLSGAWDGPVEE